MFPSKQLKIPFTSFNNNIHNLFCHITNNKTATTTTSKKKEKENNILALFEYNPANIKHTPLPLQKKNTWVETTKQNKERGCSFYFFLDE